MGIALNGEWLVLVTEPATEPVTLQELKTHMRFDGDDNSYLNSLITRARQIAEGFLARALITQTWRLTRDRSPGRRLQLPMPPLLTVTSIIGYDETDTGTTMTSTEYIVQVKIEPGEVILKSANSWPDHRNEASFEVNYTAGYGAAASDVPELIRHCILVLATKMYERRGEDVNLMLFEPDIIGLLQPFKMLDV